MCTVLWIHWKYDCLKMGETALKMLLLNKIMDLGNVLYSLFL